MAASDAIIAIVLSFYLHTSRSGFKRTDTIINRLIMFTVNTGVLTGICAVLTLITNVAFPNTFIYMIFYIIVARGMVLPSFLPPTPIFPDIITPVLSDSVHELLACDVSFRKT